MTVLGEGTSQAQELDAGNRGQAGTRGVGDEVQLSSRATGLDPWHRVTPPSTLLAGWRLPGNPGEAAVPSPCATAAGHPAAEQASGCTYDAQITPLHLHAPESVHLVKLCPGHPP